MSRTIGVSLSVFLGIASSGMADASTFTVVPFEFDPDGTNLVAARWKTGLGCPSTGVVPAAPTTTPFSDPGCPTTDSADRGDQGLLLAKSGPSAIDASAGATILGVNGITLVEIGYDLRKPDALSDPRGSHCGTGSPRFSVVTQDGTTHALGCQSPPPIQTTAGSWIRLRWDPSAARPPITSPVKSIRIVMDEGPDAGPDNFGVAVLDNNQLSELLIERTESEKIVGNIYKGRIENVLPGISSAFVNIGLEKNAYLYVSDGGHWENLGLVELLRRGCTRIVCINAGGDHQDSFGTIGEAMALARGGGQRRVLALVRENPTWAAAIRCMLTSDAERQNLAGFMSALATRYPGVVWQLYNEEDNTSPAADAQTGLGGCFGTVDAQGTPTVDGPVHYARTLEAVSTAVRAVDPSAELATGGVTSGQLREPYAIGR